MPYEPTNWKSGDVVTSAKLNKIEAGIASGGVLVATATTEGDITTLDKTWQEIHDCGFCVVREVDEGDIYFEIVISVTTNDGSYIVTTFVGENLKLYSTDSASGYPATTGGK